MIFELITNLYLHGDCRLLPFYGEGEEPFMGDLHGPEKVFVLLVKDSSRNDAPGYSFEFVELHVDGGPCACFSRAVRCELAISF